MQVTRHRFNRGRVPKEGYVGQPKGLKQVLWETSMWKDKLGEIVRGACGHSSRTSQMSSSRRFKS